MGFPSSPCLVEDEVLAFVAGELASERRGEVLRHVDRCESCRLLAAEIARDPSGEASPDQPAPPSASNLEVGELVSERFRLGAVLGRGAMGTVFRAHDEQLGTDVALKLLRRGAAGATGFAKELRVGRRITHPNVCRLYDAGSTEHYDYITMELVDGETLAEILAREELARERVVAILGEVASGLAAAHAQGVVHRDLKPANVMVERSGRAVLTDFGLAADLEGKDSRRLVGTPAYWAPEQARGERPTPLSDVYSFGVLAYRLLSGRDFTLSNDDALDDVPREFRRFVARCTAVRPGERYRDAAEMGRALAAAAHPGARRRWLAVALTACVVGAGVWSLVHRPTPPVGSALDVDAASVTTSLASSRANATATATASPTAAFGTTAVSAPAASTVVTATAAATGSVVTATVASTGSVAVPPSDGAPRSALAPRILPARATGPIAGTSLPGGSPAPAAGGRAASAPVAAPADSGLLYR